MSKSMDFTNSALQARLPDLHENSFTILLEEYYGQSMTQN